MKKLMIAAVAVACAMVASAATFDWKTAMSKGKVYVAGSTETTLSGVTAYLFNSDSVSQLALLQNFYDTGSLSAGSLSSKAIASGKISQTDGGSFTYGSVGDTLNAYFAVISGKNIFISDIAQGEGLESGYDTLQYKATEASQEAATALTAKPTTFAGSGWYYKNEDPEPTPEPTSAMLMLLGMAGLALRRKRA